MKKILAIAWKDTLIQFSTPVALLTFIILPVVFTFFLGGGLQQDAETAIALLVVDEDESETTQALLDELQASEAVELIRVDREEGEQRFADEVAPALLILPAGLEAAVLDGQTTEVDLNKIEDSTEADAVEQAVLAAISTVGRPLIVAQGSVFTAARTQPFSGDMQQQAYFSTSLEMARDQFAAAPDWVVITQKEKPASGEFVFDVNAHHSAGQLITWVFIPLLGTSVYLVGERVKGTMRRLVTTPTTSATFLGGTIFGQLGSAFVQMLLLVGFGIWVMNVDWGQSPVALLVMLFSFGLAAVAFGTMLGTFSRTEGQANNLSIALGMSMALLGGCWYPIEAFPDAVATIVHVLPTTWAMQGLTDILLRGQGLPGIALEASVLFGFAIVFFIIGIFRFRYE